MSISFTGLASGLPVDDIITQLMALEAAPIKLQEEKQASLEEARLYVDNVESKVSTLNNALQEFTDGNIAASMDLFKQKSASSSDESALTVTAGAKAVNQSFDVNIIQIATSTKAESLGSGSSSGNVGEDVTGATLVTDLANGAGKAGTFTVFYNNNPFEITINAGDTVTNVLANIDAATGGNTTSIIAGGIITIQSTGGGTINVGANGDTSNFLSATQLDVGSYAGNDLSSANPLTAIDTSGTLTNDAVHLNTTITAGTFTIGEASFTIDATTTLDSLLSDINADADAGVSASYNLRTNKIELVSKDPGQVAITLGNAGDTSNFLSAVNLVAGADTLAYQELGDNAQIQINGGATIESTSNTITDDVTGLKDVTLTLKDDTAGSDVSVNVQQDTDQLVDAINTFISSFNKVIAYIDDVTDSEDGALSGDNSLNRFRNFLRTKITDLVANSPLYSVASVGITTGDVGSEGDPSSTLKFDKDVFLDALANNPDDVRALFLGDTDDSITGIFTTLQNYTENSLDSVDGFFATRDEALQAQISDIEDSIERAYERLEAKQDQLESQFAAMETAISQLNSQSSYLTSQLSST